MIIIKNKAKKVVVLKSLGNPDLRLFPGHNNVEVGELADLKPYLSSFVAKAVFKKYLKITNCDDLTALELKGASSAKEKNDMLNKSALSIKRPLVAAANKDMAQAKQLSAQGEKIAELENTVEKLLSIVESTDE